MKNRGIPFGFLVLLMSVQLFSLPRWVRDYGAVTPYDPDEYVTGFGASEYGDDSPLEAAKLRAADDLIRKVKVEIRSNITLSANEGSGRSASGMDLVTTSTSALQLEGIEYLSEQDGSTRYALAHISRDSIARTYMQKAKETVADLEAGLNLCDVSFNAGKNGDAYDQAVNLLALFDQLKDEAGVYRFAASKPLPPEIYGRRITNEGKAAVELAELKCRIRDLSGSDAADPADAARRIAAMFANQGISASDFTVSPFLFQNTDFSSQFGQYMGQRLRSELLKRLPPSAGKAAVAVQGRYLVRDGKVELSISARSVDGSSTGAAWAEFPESQLPGDLSAEPGNYAEAIQDMLQLADGALADGGLSIEAWTTRGRDAETLVFGAGEELELYFRVNQPAFIQLTYALATGEKVLLEERFYIGVDKVNRVVKYPYAFEVVAPFGVERMIISAFSEEPPKPNVVSRLIEGEAYDVFESAAAAVMKTRGLKRVQSDDSGMNTGETILTMTTVPKLAE